MKIACLISGGVDSSVALAQLAAEGQHELKAFYLKIWLEDELAFLGECPWEDDLKYARAVCEQWHIPLEIVPLQTEYLDRVVSYTLAELRRGHTPSPDIFCNQRIKFGAFIDHIDPSYDKIMSGHYARMLQDDRGRPALYRGVDPVKDQSYFLSQMSTEQLGRCLFPLGGFAKSQVRDLANHFQLATRDRPDSQGICFLGKISFRDFVKFHLGTKTGPILELDSGKILGHHDGYWFHTIGQRKGLNLSGGPWFVVAKNTDDNVIYVTHAQHQREHQRDQFTIDDVNWLTATPPTTTVQLSCKVRHGERLYQCQLSPLGDHQFTVSIQEKDAGIAAGQFCVLYDGERCLGGGMIC